VTRAFSPSDYEIYDFENWRQAEFFGDTRPRRSPHHRTQAVRSVQLHDFRTNDFIGDPPYPPFWRRRTPWSDALAILLFLAALVAIVNAFGGFKLP
jgi:hypothetical protein